MQTTTSGVAKIGGWSSPFNPEKWRIISELSFRWFSELHDLQPISSTSNKAVVEYQREFTTSESA
jgi:hypothetical protein